MYTGSCITTFKPQPIVYKIIVVRVCVCVRVCMCACVRLSQKMFALPGNRLNLKAFSFTEQVVGHQLGVVESVQPSTWLQTQKGKR